MEEEDRPDWDYEEDVVSEITVETSNYSTKCLRQLSAANLGSSALLSSDQ